MDVASLDGLPDGTVVLMRVRAVGELAVRDMVDELLEEGLQLVPADRREIERSHARRVHHVSAHIKPEQAGGGRGVPTFGDLLDDIADLELQAGLDAVEQGTLADTTLAGDDAGLALEHVPKTT